MTGSLDTKDELLDDFTPFAKDIIPDYVAFSSQTGIPRHSKEEYKNLDASSAKNIISSAVGSN